MPDLTFANLHALMLNTFTVTPAAIMNPSFVLRYRRRTPRVTQNVDTFLTPNRYRQHVDQGVHSRSWPGIVVESSTPDRILYNRPHVRCRIFRKNDEVVWYV